MKLSVPGDKSLTQRALLLAALAGGESRLRGLLPAADPRSTADALRGLGVDVPPLPPDGREIRVRGCGLRGLKEPGRALDLGNSGTGARLLLGALTAQPLSAVLDGDASLRRRPMGRVTVPLAKMGARIQARGEPERLPLHVEGHDLHSLDYDLPVASAQVKSALLLAGLVGGVPVLLTEPGRSRDHTERMLSACGAPVVSHARGPGRRVELRDPPDRIHPLDVSIPGDLSSAAFLLMGGLLGLFPGGVEIEGVGLNPSRTGVLDLFLRMGADLDVETDPEGAERSGGEPVGTVRARASELTGIDIGADDVVAAIDEVPALVVAGIRAKGVTRVEGAGELRLKESDRIGALVRNLRAVGVEVEERADGLELEGTDRPLSGRVEAFDDHRIAMVFGVLAALPGNDIRVTGREAVDVSFPGFWRVLEELGGR